MPAEIDLDTGREPAQRILASLAHEEGGFREIVLRRDRLHGCVGQPGLERADGGRIAAEQFVGEGIDLIDRQAHGVLSPSRRTSSRSHLRKARACTSPRGNACFARNAHRNSTRGNVT